MRLVGHVFPFQNQPENDCGEQGGESVYFTFYSGEPECVAECIYQCTDQPAAHNGDKLPFGNVVLVGDDKLANQMSNTPEKEQDTGTAHQGAHVVHHFRNCRYVRSELCKKIRHQHEERCAGRVSDFQFIAGGYKLRAIPETCGRFYRHAVDCCRNDECKPTHEVVYGSVLFH